MQQISRAKRQEAVQYYLLGHPYEEISREPEYHTALLLTSLGRPTTVNWPSREVSDQIDELRQLSPDRRKKSLEPSHALLGLLLFERFRALGDNPGTSDK
jgi:hypothetical protein